MAKPISPRWAKSPWPARGRRSAGAALALGIGLIGCLTRPALEAGASRPSQASGADVARPSRASGAGAASPPGARGPELYGAGLFTTGAWDFHLAFSPEQTYALFCRSDAKFVDYDIYETRLDASGRWSPPEKPAFAREWGNADPNFFDGGRSVVFISNRPGPGETVKRESYDLWAVERLEGGRWGEPRRLPAPVNAPDVDELSPSIAANGNLYFGAERPGGKGKMDLWLARPAGGGLYHAPENLGDAINTADDEVEAWIAPDESYLIFAGFRRRDGAGNYDLYESHRAGGRWQRARPLTEINTPASEFAHTVSPDGEWLYFGSTRPLTEPVGERFDRPRNDAALIGIGDGKGDIYRIPMGALGLGGRRPP